MSSLPYYAQSLENIYRDLQTSYAGLRAKDVPDRLQKSGKNQVQVAEPVTYWDIFFEQFKSPLIYVLLAAAGIVFILGDIIDGSIIVAVILLNAVIGTFQEGRARSTLAALQTMVQGSATVLRDGVPQVIDDSEVIPGDVLLVKDGDMVAADARIIEVHSLEVSEAALTGESTSVHKENTVLNGTIPIADQQNMLFRGTHVLSGSAKAIVVATGSSTAIGGIAKKLDTLHVDVPLKENIARLSRVIVIVVALFSVLIFVAGVLTGQAPVHMFITVVAVAVSAIPESLPVVVTLVLATGVFRLSKKNVLVKRLQAVEALGQADVIALDKTGTITKNQMMVERLFVGGVHYTVTGDGYEPKGALMKDGVVTVPATHDGAILAAKVAAWTVTAHVAYDTHDQEWKRILGDPTEVALLVLAEKLGVPKRELEREYPQTLDIPFTFTSKYHGSINLVDGKKQFSVSGSPEVLLQHSTMLWTEGGVVPCGTYDKNRISNEIEQLSREGYRVLALATSETPDSSFTGGTTLPNLTFIGLVGIVDSIREGVRESVEAARLAGMHVVMITGDHEETAKTVASRVGILQSDMTILNGTTLEKLSDDALDDLIDGVAVFARVSPEHKLRIIESYKRIGKTIAMTGDGINDALSLTAADLGVAMGKVGTEVAREAADLVVLDDNFGNIRVAVEEGRAMYQTIRTAVLYLLSTNIGELLVIAVAVLLGWPLPLLATQIIWLNMVTDTFLVAALAMEPKQKRTMKRRTYKPSKYLVDWQMGLRIMLIGGVMTIGTLYMFKGALNGDMVKAWTIALTTLTVFQWYNIWNVRSAHRSVFGQSPLQNKWLLAGLLVSIALHMVAIYVPAMQKILQTTGLSLAEWGSILGISLLVIFVEEARKAIIFLHKQSKSSMQIVHK